MTKELIKRYKNYQKRKFISSNNKQNYAFVGMGTHSIYNLYPIINHFRLNLKYIITKTPDNATLIDQHFPHSIGTTDIEKVLNDPEITGIFISTNPQAHYDLIKKALIANKNVFVEKPPCSSEKQLDELIKIEQTSHGTCIVGLQKQYAPSNQKLKQQINNKCTYNYRYLTGAYPEGDTFLDLFIHPISLINFLFGKIKTQNLLLRNTKGELTIFQQIEHSNGIIGSVELSTNYSWQNPLEKLTVNTTKGTFTAKNTENLSFEPTGNTILGLPIEKIIRKNNQKIQLQKRNNFTPILTENQLYTSGYYNEIKTFIEICNSEKTTNNSTLKSCKPAYEIIFNIKNTHNV